MGHSNTELSNSGAVPTTDGWKMLAGLGTHAVRLTVVLGGLRLWELGLGV